MCARKAAALSCSSGSRRFSRRRPRGGAHPRLGHQPGRAEQRADGPERVGPTGARSRGLGQAGVAAADIGYVEAHGTGTPSATPSSSPPSAPSCARGGRAKRRVTSAQSRLTSAILKRLRGSPDLLKSHSPLSVNTSRHIYVRDSTRVSRLPTRRWRSRRAGATGSEAAGRAVPA